MTERLDELERLRDLIGREAFDCLIRSAVEAVMQTLHGAVVAILQSAPSDPRPRWPDGTPVDGVVVKATPTDPLAPVKPAIVTFHGE